MKKEDIFLILLIVAGLTGIYFLGSGITGMVISDQTTKPICTTDNDCSAPDVCCLFYQESSGVCHEKEMCQSITEITMNEKEQNLQIFGNNIQRAERIKTGYLTEIIASIIIVLLVCFSLYHHITKNKTKTEMQELSNKNKE